MWDWLTQSFPGSQAPTARSTARRLALEMLEAREVPAVTIQIDYSFDTSGFFNDPARRAVLQQAANDIAAHIDTPLAAITPDATNTWTATFYDPATGQQRSVNNPVIPANTIKVFAGGRNQPGSEAGEGGPGGYGASGFQNWFNTIQTRGTGTNAPWGGSLAFDTGTNWFVGTTTSGIGSNQVDFYSVASHELGHLLGIGTSQQWFAQVSGGAFRGVNASSAYGGAVPVYGDHAHWADQLTAGGARAAMDPILQTGARIPFSALDYAALRDIGWTIDGGASQPPVSPGPTLPPPPPPITPPPIGNPNTRPVVLTGTDDGSAQAFTLSPSGVLSPTGTRMVPFAGWTGVVRSTVADFNGDGIADYAFATGPGTAAQVRIVDGRTGADLAPATLVLDGFGGGVFLAAGDMNKDGAAELAVSADAGGGNRVSIYTVNGGFKRVVDFMAFGDANFRGGSRVAMGDVNHDGAGDLIVGAGLGGGPRVAIYDGNSLMSGRANQLVPDFFALDPSLRSGVFVTAADLNGDGFADVIYSTGNTGGPRVRVVSGAVLTANPGKDAYFLPAMADFFALDPNDRNGIRIAARDMNGDGKAELIVGSGDKASAAVRVFTGDSLGKSSPPIQSPFTDPTTIDGVYVG